MYLPAADLSALYADPVAWDAPRWEWRCVRGSAATAWKTSSYGRPRCWRTWSVRRIRRSRCRVVPTGRSASWRCMSASGIGGPPASSPHGRPDRCRLPGPGPSTRRRTPPVGRSGCGPARARLAAAVRQAGPEARVWTWADDQSASFWLRRMVHETVIHHADAAPRWGARPRSPPTSPPTGSLLLQIIPYVLEKLEVRPQRWPPIRRADQGWNAGWSRLSESNRRPIHYEPPDPTSTYVH